MASIVSLKRCSSYAADEAAEAVRACIDSLGGMGMFVSPGETVLIKPNLLSARPPEECVTTHPEIVRAVIRLVRKAGGSPAVGDSPGGSRHSIEEVYERTGIGKICEQEETPRLFFDDFKMVEGIPIALHALACDRIVSVPKFKTHSLTLITAGVKNMFGVVPGLYKTRCHLERPGPSSFSKFLAGVYRAARADLTIIDGVLAMEGEGPGRSGTPRKMELVAASADAVSVDAVLCAIAGIDPGSAPTVREAARLKLGEGNLENIEIKGDDLFPFIRPDFKLPRSTFLHRTPEFMLKPLASLLNMGPEAAVEKCSLCGECVKTCPAGACRAEKGMIVFDSSACVLCLCCMEMCPEGAVRIKKNIFARLLGF